MDVGITSRSRRGTTPFKKQMLDQENIQRQVVEKFLERWDTRAERIKKYMVPISKEKTLQIYPSVREKVKVLLESALKEHGKDFFGPETIAFKKKCSKEAYAIIKE